MLDEDHYGLPDVKDRVLEFLAVRQLRAQQLEEELKQTGEMSISKLKATKEDATPQLGGTRTTRPADHRREGSQGARDGEGPDSAVRRTAGRRQDVDRQIDRALARSRSTCASRSAARATKPTSAATGARTSARCPDASFRA